MRQTTRSDEEVVDWWLDLFREWCGTLNQDRLYPVLPIPGNHEVGNHTWDGTGSVNPEQGVFQFFYGYPRYLDPVGENYGEVTIGDHLQLLALDTHSAYPEDVADWLGGAINENVLCTIPYHHSPMLTGGTRRQPEDDELQELLRDEWLRLLRDDESMLCHFAGHIHFREYTVPYEVVDEEPTSGDYIALDDGADGYLVENDDTNDYMMQFGTGYRANRSYDEWFTDYIAEENQFYSVTLPSSELEVRELDGSGDQYESHTFSTGWDGGSEEDLSVTTDGATNVDESSAMLNGSLDDLGSADSADVYFEWGPSGDLSNTTELQTLTSTGTFSGELADLSTDTEYEYRAVAEASDGETDTGSSVTFTTTTSVSTVIEVIAGGLYLGALIYTLGRGIRRRWTPWTGYVVGTAVGLSTYMTFESLLLGGLSTSSVVLGLIVGLMLLPAERSTTAGGVTAASSSGTAKRIRSSDRDAGAASKTD